MKKPIIRVGNTLIFQPRVRARGSEPTLAAEKTALGLEMECTSNPKGKLAGGLANPHARVRVGWKSSQIPSQAERWEKQMYSEVEKSR